MCQEFAQPPVDLILWRGAGLSRAQRKVSRHSTEDSRNSLQTSTDLFFKKWAKKITYNFTGQPPRALRICPLRHGHPEGDERGRGIPRSRTSKKKVTKTTCKIKSDASLCQTVSLQQLGLDLLRRQQRGRPRRGLPRPEPLAHAQEPPPPRPLLGQRRRNRDAGRRRRRRPGVRLHRGGGRVRVQEEQPRRGRAGLRGRWRRQKVMQCTALLIF